MFIQPETHTLGQFQHELHRLCVFANVNPPGFQIFDIHLDHAPDGSPPAFSHLRREPTAYNSAGWIFIFRIIAQFMSTCFSCFSGSKLEQATGEHWGNVQGLPSKVLFLKESLLSPSNGE